jgi:hypothetical protein
MIVEDGGVTRHLARMTDPPMIVKEPEAVGHVAVEWRLVERGQVPDERVEPLGLLLG